MSQNGFIAVCGSPAAVEHRLNETGLAADLQRRGMKLALAAPAVAVFVAPETPFLLVGPAGVVVGPLFAREGAGPAKRIARFDERTASAILGTAGDLLIESYWGSYVAILGGENGGTAVLRDPSGGIPVYFTGRGGAQIYFSDPAVALELGLVTASVDAEFLRQWLVFPHLRTARSGLARVFELLPGTRGSDSPAGPAIESVWSPWVFASRRAQMRDFGEAAAAVRETARTVIPAYAEGARQLLLELSGGLDSSIVAAALAEGGIPFSSVNFATRSPDGDERRYARLAAAAASSRLAELIHDGAPLDLRQPEPRLRPGLNPVLQPIDNAFSEYARTIGADRFLSGAGGDSLFCYLTTASSAVDAALVNGLGAAATALRNVSSLCECTYWTAARYALRKARRRKQPRPWRVDLSFLPPELGETVAERHPWLEAPADALPGKREHVEALVTIQYFLDGGGRERTVPAAYPLMAQPLLELCLTIPTWMWNAGGRNRAVARAAFADLLPPAILERRGKGRLESMCARAFVETREALREVLLDGLLAEQHLIDRSALEASLKHDPEPGDARYFRIFDLVTLELWLRSLEPR